MKRDLPPYVYRVTARGQVYHYFRKGGVTARIDPDAPSFWADYAKCREQKPILREGKRTWKVLIARYRDRDAFKKLSHRTKKDYEAVLGFVAERYGPLDPAKMRKVHIVEQQDALTGKFARDFVNVISVLLRTATEIGWRDDNPAIGIARKQTDRKSPHVVWTDEAVAKFRAEASKLPLLIFEIGIGTAQRPDDWTRLDWEDYDGAAIHMTQSKTGKELVIPCPDALVSALESARPKVRNIGRTPILQLHGKRLTYRHMAAIMLRERQRLGLSQFDLHALRYRGVQELAWSGCSDEEIMSISGHSSKEMVKKYAGAARQITRAKQANAKRKSLAVTVTKS